MGMRNIVAEGDSSLTIGAVNSSSLDHSIAGVTVEAVKLLSQSFSSFKLIHVRRGGNEVAHCMQKLKRSKILKPGWRKFQISFML
ncbi:hypothetical protein REPUB_Repub09cG0138700 [Reevesia pubescens]